MPYKDSRRKKEWEVRHRTERIRRRQELREKEGQKTQYFDVPWQVVVGGGLLALCPPTLALCAGGLILLTATNQKSWKWGATGAVVVVFALFLLKPKERDQNNPEK
jgi:hypothetical protein